MVHLHTRSTYSLLNNNVSVASVPALVRQAKALGQTALALTDTDCLSGVVEFEKACRDAGIRPIYGIDLVVTPSIRVRKTQDTTRLTLLAANNTGFSNLVKIASVAATEGYYYRPRCDLELLSQYREGVIVLSGDRRSELATLLGQNAWQEARELAARYRNIFGANYYIEVQNHGIQSERRLLPLLIRLARELKIPLVATNSSCFLRREDAEACMVMTAINQRKTAEDTYQIPASYHLRSEEDMMRDFQDSAPEAVKNTDLLAARCAVDLPLGFSCPPIAFPPAGWADGFRYLLSRGLTGLQERFGGEAAGLEWMLKRELEAARQNGFLNQLLILLDLADCARERGVLLGPGCGEASASLLLYCLGVSSVNPIACGLDPDRYLNRGLTAFPPFSLELGPDGRKVLLERAVETQHASHLALCMSFFRRSANSAIRSAGTALGIDVSPLLPFFPPGGTASIRDTINANPDLLALFQQNGMLRKALNNAMYFAGQLRGIQRDPTALLFAPGPVSDFVPVSKNTKTDEDLFLTQVSAEDAGKLGLWRIDLKETAPLAFLQDILNQLPEEDRTSFRPDPLPDLSPVDGKTVWDLLAEGEVAGIELLDRPDLRALLMEAKPRTIQELMAVLACRDPGRRNALSACARFWSGGQPSILPELRPYLASTWGEILYQEQITSIFMMLAGLTMQKADLSCGVLRNRKPRQVANLKNVFLNGKDEAKGCLARGVSAEAAELIWSRLTAAAPSASSRAQAAGEATQVLRILWARLHFPPQYLASCLTTSSPEQRMARTEEILGKGISILPVDINASSWEYVAEGSDIRSGFLTVPDITREDIRALEAGRKKGPFASLQDLINRCPKLAQNKAPLEKLIRAGACDSLDENRNRNYLLALLPVLSPAPAKGRRKATP